MKKSTAEILLFFYLLDPDGTASFQIGYEVMYEVLEERSQTGVRSSVRTLVKKGQLRKMLRAGKTTFLLTKAGRLTVGKYYPILRQLTTSPLQTEKGDEKWWGCSFLQTPESAKHSFSALRQKLLDDGAWAAGRGMFFKSRPFSDEVVQWASQHYATAVTVFVVDQFVLGAPSERGTGSEEFSQRLSGVSGKMDLLLHHLSTKNSLDFHTKHVFLSHFVLMGKFLSENWSGITQSELHQLRGDLLKWSQLLRDSCDSL